MPKCGVDAVELYKGRCGRAESRRELKFTLEPVRESPVPCCFQFFRHSFLPIALSPVLAVVPSVLVVVVQAKTNSFSQLLPQPSRLTRDIRFTSTANPSSTILYVHPRPLPVFDTSVRAEFIHKLNRFRRQAYKATHTIVLEMGKLTAPLPTIPSSLKLIQPYVLRADELETKDPIMAYWCE